MRFKAVLIGATLPPLGGKGDRRPWAVMCRTQQECEALAKNVLESLSEDDQKVARVDIEETVSTLVAEIHVAAVQPEDGPMAFAIARHQQTVGANR